MLLISVYKYLGCGQKLFVEVGEVTKITGEMVRDYTPL